MRGRLAAARFPSPLIKPDVPFSSIRLSDRLHHQFTEDFAFVIRRSTPSPLGRYLYRRSYRVQTDADEVRFRSMEHAPDATFPFFVCHRRDVAEIGLAKLFQRACPREIPRGLCSVDLKNTYGRSNEMR